MIVGKITSTVYDCWRVTSTVQDCWPDYMYCIGLLVGLHVLHRIVGEITSTV